MTRTDKIWEHADAAFAEVNKAFAEADKLFAEAQPESARRTKTDHLHQVHFEARTRAERWRLTRKFFRMAFTMLFTGKTRIHFKDR
jgi:hypothetical protein